MVRARSLGLLCMLVCSVACIGLGSRVLTLTLTLTLTASCFFKT